MMLLPMVAMADKSGTCGDNLTWTLVESTGTLTISGSGAMNNYTISYSIAPWYDDRAKILAVVIENGVTSIGQYAFYNCTGLTSFTIPNSVTSIGRYAFAGCSGLTSVTIPNSVKGIGGGVFSACSELNSIVIENGNSVYDSRDNCNAIIETSTNTLVIGCKSTIIPNSVTSIGGYAFAFCSSLTSIEIPNSVTTIGGGAFRGCSGLTSITIPNSVTSIGGYAFSQCSSLASVTIPNSVTSIGYYVFQKCSELNSIVVENGNSVYDSRDNCNAIIETSTNTLVIGCKSTIIPNSVTSIGDGAFAGSSLTSIEIPNSVTSIGLGAFQSCSNLISIIIPNSLASIESYTFEGCSSLSTITIPNSVTYIGNGAFDGCSGLTSITSLNPTPPICNSNSFKGVDHTISVYVPVGSVLKYKVADVWKDFVVFREISDETEDFVLSISDGGHGKTQLLVDDAKPYFTLVFKADDGWKIHSVTLNGDNVTYEVGEDGKYTTPPLTASSSLNVVYEQSSSQGINAVNGTPIRVRGANGEIIISRNSSEITSVTVYQIDGKQILQQSLSDIETHISLPEGHVYIIKAGNQQYKVGL